MPTHPTPQGRGESPGNSGFICLYFGPADECRSCGGWTKAAGGPFEGDSRFCSEDCYVDWDERYRQAVQRAKAKWCPDCGYDQGEHAPDCASLLTAEEGN